jgi:hypothetical protein
MVRKCLLNKITSEDMKKTYIIPTVKVQAIRLTQVLSASPSVTFGSGTTNEFDGREDNAWGDWDED